MIRIVPTTQGVTPPHPNVPNNQYPKLDAMNNSTNCRTHGPASVSAAGGLSHHGHVPWTQTVSSACVRRCLIRWDD